MWIKDPKTQNKSVTVTLLVWGFIAGIFKLLLADATIKGITFGGFTGTDFAAMIGAIGAVYGFRKHTDKDKK